MHPLPVSDPKLKDKIQRAIADLEKYYPDRKVSGLEKEHKGLANRLGEAAKQAGYSSRLELMEAYGFQSVSRGSAGSQGGRPVSIDAGAVFAELRSRYQSKALPKTLGELTEQNPDLAGNLKTLTNKSRELFGDTIKEVLIEEGLLDAKPKSKSPQASREHVEAMVDDLLEIYGNSMGKPKTIKALQRVNPEYADELDALITHAKQWFGMTAKKYLMDAGVLAASEADVDASTAASAVDELERIFANRPDSEKPRSIKELLELAPEYEARIALLRKSWDTASGTTFAESLRQRGILRQSEAERKRIRKETVKRCARNATLEELVDVWARAGGASVLLSRCASPLLPERVRGIDADALVELRETTLCATASHATDLHAGLSLSYSAQGFRFLFKDAMGEMRFSISYPTFGDNGVYQEIVECPSAKSAATALSDCVGAEVVSASDTPDGSCFVQVKMRYLHSLTTQTMLNLLVRAELITDDDLLGGDAWRSRDFAALGVPASYAQLAENASAPSLDDDGAEGSELADDTLDPVDASDSAVEADLPNEFDPDREGKIAVLQMAALTAALGSDGLPEDIIDELNRAADGDETADVDDLARRVNDLLPSIHAVDPSAWTFEMGLRASTSQFSVAIPDGYRVVKDYTEKGIFELERPFVVVPGNVPDKDIPNCDRIIAVSGSEAIGDPQIADMFDKYGIDEFFVAMRRNSAYCSEVEFAPKTLHDQVIEGANGRSLLRVIPSSNSNGFEYYLEPCALGVSDWLRIPFSNASLEDEPTYRPFVEKLASTLEIVDEKRCQLLLDLDRCREERVDAEHFETTVIGFGNVLGICREMENEANLSKARDAVDSFTAADAVATVVEGISSLVESELSYCEQALEALKRQAELGAPANDLKRMYDAVKELHGSFETHVSTEGDPEAEKALKERGDIRLPSRYAEVAAEIEAFATRYLTDSGQGKAEGSQTDACAGADDAVVGNVEAGVSPGFMQEEAGQAAFARQSKIEPWCGSRLFSAAAEAALEDLRRGPSGTYVGKKFVSQSEKIIGSILSQQQAEADAIARRQYGGDEGRRLLLQLHEELGHVLCRVLDAYVSCIERECEAGCDSRRLGVMLEETGEVVSLIKQDPTIEDPQLGNIQIGKARVPAELGELDARRKDLREKVNERKKQENAKRKVELARQKEEQEKLEAEKQKERLARKIEQLEARLARERQALEKIQHAITDQQLAELESGAKAVRNRIADLEREKESLGLLKFSQKREISTRIAQHQHKLDGIKTQIESLRAEAEEQRQREARLRSSVDDAERQLEELKGKF